MLAAVLATQLVFSCGPAYENICRASPDGVRAREWSAAPSAQEPYSGVAISRDGTRFAYIYNGAVLTGPVGGRYVRQNAEPFVPALVRFREDGLRYAVAESAAIGGTQVCSYNSDGTGEHRGRYCLATGVSSGFDYTPDGRIVMSGREQGVNAIVLLRPEDGQGGGAERVLVRDPAADLESPSLSPDGRLVAVVRGGIRGPIALYDVTTGALVRQLTSDQDASPAFSPDGRSVAFDRGGWIHVMPAAGGTPRRIWPGRSPDWAAARSRRRSSA